MPAIVKSSEVERVLRNLLLSEGFTLTPERTRGENGVDILATRDGEPYHIEVIAYKSQGSTRARDFYEAFFRAISRLNDGAKHCVLALSQQWEYGLPQRAKHHYDAWLRIANAFPELDTWIVNVEGQTYRRVPWYEWAPLPGPATILTISPEAAEALKEQKDIG